MALLADHAVKSADFLFSGLFTNQVVEAVLAPPLFVQNI